MKRGDGLGVALVGFATELLQERRHGTRADD
jgi:hypothetical protein